MKISQKFVICVALVIATLILSIPLGYFSVKTFGQIGAIMILVISALLGSILAGLALETWFQDQESVKHKIPGSE